MEVIILGAGAVLPHPLRGQAGILVKGIEGAHLLFDSGSGILQKLSRVGISLESLKNIFYTHVHPDHIVEIISILFAKRSPDIQNPPFLNIWGGEGIAEIIGRIMSAFDPWLTPMDYELKIRVCDKEIEIGEFRIIPARVSHHESSLAYRLEGKEGRSIAISGDTDFCREMIGLAHGVDLLVLECAFPEWKKVPGHLIPSEAAKIANDAGVKRLLLTHFYPLCKDEEILKECRRHFKGELYLAKDYMHIII